VSRFEDRARNAQVVPVQRRSTGVGQIEAETADQPRDLHGASRAVAYLMLTAAPYVLATGAILPRQQALLDTIAVVVTCVVLVVGGIYLRTRAHTLPPYFWRMTPFIAVAFTTGMNLLTVDASTGAQIFYLWPVLYAAMYLDRRLIYTVLAATFAGEAIVVFVVLTPGQALADLTAMMVAMSMSALVVTTLRERADSLLKVLETQALADPLTGLGNRRSFDRDLADAQRWVRRSGGPLAMLSVDLDHFKGINDNWGHAVGDRALQIVAASMTAVARETDVVARLGGDEFVMLLRADRGGALRVADALRDAIAASDGLPGGPPEVSIGLAVLPDDADTVEALRAASDAALYGAKMSGRGRTASARSVPVEAPA
jgi:diguanylate cyclase (GGDEF)-like protein